MTDQEKKDAQKLLVLRLSSQVGWLLVREWERLTAEERVASMGSTMVAALGHSLATLMGALALPEPENIETWEGMVAQTLEAVRASARLRRTLALRLENTAPTWPDVSIREPKTVM